MWLTIILILSKIQGFIFSLKKTTKLQIPKGDSNWISTVFLKFMKFIKKRLRHSCFHVNFVKSLRTATGRKMRFSIKDFFSKSDQICIFQLIWSHLLKKSLLENSIFDAVRFFYRTTPMAISVFWPRIQNLIDIALAIKTKTLRTKTAT